MNNTIMLKKNYEFKKMFLKGKHYYAKHIDIYINSNNNEKINKFGIAVGRKTAKSVQRHRIRRVIKEIYRLIEKEINCGKNILIVWKKNANIEEANFYVIKKEIEEIFKKAGLYKKA